MWYVFYGHEIIRNVYRKLKIMMRMRVAATRANGSGLAKVWREKKNEINLKEL